MAFEILEIRKHSSFILICFFAGFEGHFVIGISFFFGYYSHVSLFTLQKYAKSFIPIIPLKQNKSPIFPFS